MFRGNKHALHNKEVKVEVSMFIEWKFYYSCCELKKTHKFLHLYVISIIYLYLNPL